MNRFFPVHRFFFFGFFLFFPFLTQAHVKWFVDSDAIIEQEKIHFSFTDERILAWIGISIVCIIISFILEKKLSPSKKLLAWKEKRETMLLRIFEILIGVHLLMTPLFGYTIAPLFEIDTTSLSLLVITVLSACIGALLVMGTLRAVAGMLLIVLFILASIIFHPLALLEHVHMLGLGFFFILSSPSVIKRFPAWKEWNFPLLRITLGIALIVLGLQEKILHPELALQFLETHPWNFMSLVGIEWFTDELFVISSGMTEILFGIIFLLGTVTRINTLALTVFFVTTAIILGPKEINGHFTLIAIALLFIVFGSGKKCIMTNCFAKFSNRSK